MNKKLITVLVILAMATIVGIGANPTPSVSAAGFTTTSLHIVKYAPDGTTVIAQTTIDYVTMNATLPVQGDGVTHYFTQGPTFDPNNLWDPAETVNVKDKGAVMGTDLKDLCNLVGGMSSTDTVKVHAADNYGNDIFPYANVYAPDPRQGKMVICWYNADPDSGNPGYVPDYSNGMLLVFMAQTTNAAGQHVFGHQDMHDCLPQSDWHFYYDGAIQYPSTDGLYCKYVSEIDIYTGTTSGWSVVLSGARTDTLTQTWLEDALGASCHGTTTYTDSYGNVWGGLPLWYVCGIVDDTTNIHGPGAFNDNLYYDVKVTGTGGYYYTFPSTDIARNNNIILANTENGTALSADKYPLKLVSPSFTVGGPSVAGITKIELLNISASPPSWPPIEPTAADWPLKLYGAQAATITQSAFAAGATCHLDTYSDASGTWAGIALGRLMGWVADANQHGPGAFNDSLAAAGYDVKVIGADGYYYDFASADLARNDNIILANTLNGQPLPLNDGASPNPHPLYPLKLVGSGLTGTGSKVGSVVRIDLRNIPALPAWDLNNDHVCNISDVVKIGLKWGMTGSAGWIPEDLNKDGVINIGDVVVLGLHWGQTW